MDNAPGLVVGREALNERYNQRILPPINSCPQGRPRQRRIESQREGLKVRSLVLFCLECHWLQDEIVWYYFHLIDEDFPKRVKEVIDDFARQHAIPRDWLLDDRNAQLWTRDEDMHLDAERRVEVETLKKLLGVAIGVTAILLTMCIQWVLA
ncbi:hypothetical protein Cgig2_000330 [Carnegiea gigantea]|uniref:Uncharacterized protein n=1 Tax=Carnegiea gigantea TaxID=171969 RepID=A0A9Q1JL05_9CARY|nr:hypothetical protein Cgig2_000330 [Carnegiea gigantea]